MVHPFVDKPRYRLEPAFGWIKSDTKSLLDYGCGDGKLLGYLRKKNSQIKLYGLEVDKKALKILHKTTSGVRFISNLRNVKDNSCEIVTLLDVIEHVPDEIKTLDEIARVLKSGGCLLLSTPHKGITEIFDPGNVKFRFPGLHKLLFERIFKQKGYKKKYLGKGMVGDISRQDINWHRHYSSKDLKKLLSKNFIIKEIRYYGLFFPLLSMLDQAYLWVRKKECKIIRKLVLMDSRINFGRLSFSIFINAIKK